jgi:hypothetical protein
MLPRKQIRNVTLNAPCFFLGYCIRVCILAEYLRIKSEFGPQSLKEVYDITSLTDVRLLFDGRSAPYVVSPYKFVQMFTASCLRHVQFDTFYITCDLNE